LEEEPRTDREVAGCYRAGEHRRLPQSEEGVGHLVPKVVVSHEEIPADRMLLHGIDTSAGPIFTVSEVAKIFFCRSSHWLRLQEYKGLYLDGQKVEPARAGKTEVRQYTL